MPGGRDFSRELYPFLHPDSQRDPGSIGDAVAKARSSTLQKCGDIVCLRTQLGDECSAGIVSAAIVIAEAFLKGGKLLALGCGGSATDASDAAVDCLAPAAGHWRSLRAISLCADIGVVTGIANDVGFESVFSRQIIALGEPGDVVLAFTTSGRSPSVLKALREAKRRGLTTVVLSGGSGGAATGAALADHSFIARLDYVPRIQEGHATVWHALLELVHIVMGDRPLSATA